MDKQKISGNTVSEYHQIRRHVFALITSSKPGSEMIPLTTERELCELFGVSRGTARKALKLLSDEGLIIRRPHYGTFINPKVFRRSLHMPMVGVLVGNGERMYFDSLEQAILAGLYHEASMSRCLLYPIQFFGNSQHVIDIDLKRHLSGIIWLWPSKSMKTVAKAISASAKPLINVIPKTKCSYGSIVSMDLEHYGYELTRKLLKLGHSDDILFLDTDDKTCNSKRQGIDRAFSENNMKFNSDNFIRGTYNSICNELEKRMAFRNYNVINATGEFFPIVPQYPSVKFIIPKVSIELCNEDDEEPCLAIPSFTIGKMAMKMMNDSLACPDKQPEDKKVKLQFSP